MGKGEVEKIKNLSSMFDRSKTKQILLYERVQPSKTIFERGLKPRIMPKGYRITPHDMAIGNSLELFRKLKIAPSDSERSHLSWRKSDIVVLIIQPNQAI